MIMSLGISPGEGLSLIAPRRVSFVEGRSIKWGMRGKRVVFSLKDLGFSSFIFPSNVLGIPSIYFILFSDLATAFSLRFLHSFKNF